MWYRWAEIYNKSYNERITFTIHYHCANSSGKRIQVAKNIRLLEGSAMKKELNAMFGRGSEYLYYGISDENEDELTIIH